MFSDNQQLRVSENRRAGASSTRDSAPPDTERFSGDVVSPDFGLRYAVTNRSVPGGARDSDHARVSRDGESRLPTIFTHTQDNTERGFEPSNPRGHAEAFAATEPGAISSGYRIRHRDSSNRDPEVLHIGAAVVH